MNRRLAKLWQPSAQELKAEVQVSMVISKLQAETTVS